MRENSPKKLTFERPVLDGIIPSPGRGGISLAFQVNNFGDRILKPCRVQQSHIKLASESLTGKSLIFYTADHGKNENGFKSYESPQVEPFMSRLIRNFCMAAVVFLSFLILGEMTVRFLEKYFLFYDLEMTRYANHLKQDSSNPAIRHIHRPLSKAMLMGVPVQINADGFRDENYPVARNSKYRVIFLGDSLTLGWGVRSEETFEYLIEKYFNDRIPAEIINFGTGNYNTVQEVHLFLEKGLKYKPDKVVLFYFINDAEPLPQKAKWGFWGHSHLLTLYWSRLHAAIERIQPSRNFSAYYHALYASDQPGWQQAKEALLLLKTVCVDRQIKLQVVLLPELHQLQPYTFQQEHALIKTFLSEHKIDFLDVAPSFSKEIHPERLWVARDDAHPNAVAHRLIAEAVRDFVIGTAIPSPRPS